MLNKIHKKTGTKEGEVAGENIQPRPGKLGKSPAIVNEPPQEDRKIDVEIREVVRVAPKNFAAFKKSFEEWASKWE